MIKTYQDLLAVGDSEIEREKFIVDAVTTFKSSDKYATAVEAEEYASGRNPLISKYQKFLYTISGEQVPDNYTANHKMKSGLYKRCITQKASYLLGNGLICKNDAKNHDKLGQAFDKNLYFYSKSALATSCSFGFWNVDHVDWFKYTEFCPLQDEETGEIKAGIRFWQLDINKPLRMTLFELDGFTEYEKNSNGDIVILAPKRAYRLNTGESEMGGLVIKDGENYDKLPIVPLYGTFEQQSTLIGVKEQVDCYDMIKSGFANDLDDASMLYWTLTNYGGMDDVDLVKFVERMKTIKAATVEGDGAKVESHTVDVPYQSREAYLAILKKDFIEDTQMLNVEQIQAGNVTATQIEAAYEPINEAADEFEYLIIDFCEKIFEFAGIDDIPTFKRSQMKNQTEETQMILTAANYLDDDTIIEKLPFLSNDEVEIVKRKRASEDVERFREQSEQLEEQPEGEE